MTIAVHSWRRPYAKNSAIEESSMNMLSTCFIKGNDFVTRCIAGETIIVPVRAHVVDLDAIYTLNEVGTLIWERLDGRTNVSQVVDVLCEVYDVAPDEATQDIVDFLDALQTTGLIAPAAVCEA
jgi:hypothetical protein